MTEKEESCESIFNDIPQELQYHIPDNMKDDLAILACIKYAINKAYRTGFNTGQKKGYHNGLNKWDERVLRRKRKYGI